MKLRQILIPSLLFIYFCASAQKPVGIAYYDVERLYDTIPALFHNDEAYTPDGKLHWNTERYERKIRNIAAVIDSMQMPLMALCGVENEAVVRDLATACRSEYSYLHRTLNSLDGMDFALLYYGDLFMPDHTETGRGYLYVEGQLRGERIGLLMTKEKRFGEWAIQELREMRPNAKLILLGRTEEIDAGALGLTDPHHDTERAGHGNIRSRAGWRLRDRIVADTALRIDQSGIYARRYLIESRTGSPLPTYDNNRYKGGYSYALPVFIYLK